MASYGFYLKALVLYRKTPQGRELYNHIKEKASTEFDKQVHLPKYDGCSPMLLRYYRWWYALQQLERTYRSSHKLNIAKAELDDKLSPKQIEHHLKAVEEAVRQDVLIEEHRQRALRLLEHIKDLEQIQQEQAVECEQTREYE